MNSVPEPWLRGPLKGVDTMLAPAIFALQQAGEDLVQHTQGLTDEQVWSRPLGLAPLGFQLRHIAGSIDRLCTYLRGGNLTDAQLSLLRSEMEPGEPLESLLAKAGQALTQASEQIQAIDPATLTEPRFVGRKRLPTTVIGLVVHIAEHTQRHLGQAISAAKLARAAASQ